MTAQWDGRSPCTQLPTWSLSQELPWASAPQNNEGQRRMALQEGQGHVVSGHAGNTWLSALAARSTGGLVEEQAPEREHSGGV